MDESDGGDAPYTRKRGLDRIVNPTRSDVLPKHAGQARRESATDMVP
jgi:hypothetical protein